ncbi:MAG: hypothetical protein KDB37_23290, partial [Ilumatobacter sp.]|nr:hypothetical protein [Ilumatobacter sp.]
MTPAAENPRGLLGFGEVIDGEEQLGRGLGDEREFLAGSESDRLRSAAEAGLRARGRPHVHPEH